ncbi:hypothetical protein [Rhodalgimonas zhirmunskyi]|uniref:NADH dehydrogenase subunit E n=1 Tax=Rhodalgimonas zhirmunskyi TaxID=2964767 RepID=A0AAJ1X895_9RHOB|nr:hypothetical protein [Rhodoalgimonas zhirmunskyi]MDQ2095377.1 hypothetical protein [Rhodoalgimonas zhirmunskyi]
MMEKIGVCGLVSWLVGLVVGIWAYVAVSEMTFWLPAVLIGVALAAFIGLVLGGLFCGLMKGDDAAHGAAHDGAAAGHHDHAHADVGIEALAEAEAGALEAGARAAGIDPAEAAREKEMLDARINAERSVDTAEGEGAEVEAAAEARAETKAEAVAADAPETVTSEAPAADETESETETETAASGTGSALADEFVSEAEAGDRDAGADALAAAAATPDYDGDGVHEGTDEGAKPATLSAPRDGGADNLKEIKGVGPKLEAMLHGMGFYHFDQIASWGADEVAWVDANIKGFKGRVSRDNWVEQAKILASGGDTEFSSRVGKGEVY